MNNKLHLKFSDFVNEMKSEFNKFEINDILLNKIYEGYAEAAIFTEEDKLIEVNDDVDLNIYNIDEASKESAISDIKNFIDFVGKDAIDEAIGENGPDFLGHDIWLTRNGHGAGFMDRDYEYVALLQAGCDELGEISLIVGDDGKLYFE